MSISNLTSSSNNINNKDNNNNNTNTNTNTNNNKGNNTNNNKDNTKDYKVKSNNRIDCNLDKISNLTLEEYNSYIEEKRITNLDYFNSINPNKTIKINKSIIEYNIDIKILVCSRCKLTLRDNIDTILEHLLKKHYNLYNKKKNKKSYLEIKEALIAFINNNTFNNFNSLTSLEYNKFYYNNLELVLGFKAKICNYTNISRKAIKLHLNNIHNLKETNKKNPNIIENTPILRIKGFPNNKIIEIIPKLENNDSDPISIDLEKESTSISTSSSNKARNNIAKSIASYRTTKSNIIKDKEEDISLININKEGSFFNRTTKYYRYFNNLTNLEVIRILELINSINIKNNIYYNLIYTTIIELGLETSSLIESLTNINRVNINKVYLDNTSTNIRYFKELTSNVKKAYFKEFSILLIFLIEVYKDKDKFYKFKTILNKDLEKKLERFIELENLYLFNYNKPNYNNNYFIKAFKDLFLDILIILLELDLELDTTLENKFNNPIIELYVLKCLNIEAIYNSSNNSIIFKKENTLSKVNSIFIYNTRLYLLAYIYKEFTTKNITNKTFYFNNILTKYITMNSNNYFIELYLLRNKLKSYTIRAISSFKPISNIEEDNFKFNNITININTLKLLFNTKLEELESLLFKDLLLFNINSKEDSIVNIDLSKIEDNLDNNTLNYSFLEIDYINNIRDTLIERFLTKDTLIYKAFNNRKTIRKNIENYLKTINKFLELLLLNIYYLSTSPLRGEELILIKYKNNKENIRNIYFDSNLRLITINTTFNKTLDLNSYNKNNIRFLPSRLSIVLIYYLVLIIPLEEYIYLTYFNNKTIRDPRLFTYTNRTNTLSFIKSITLSKYIKDSFKEFFNTNSISLSYYRHLIIFIIKKKIIGKSRLLENYISNKTLVI